MSNVEVLATVEGEKVSAQIVALTATTGRPLLTTLLHITDYREVRPLRIENYPSLAKVWDEHDDDDLFADTPGV